MSTPAISVDRLAKAFGGLRAVDDVSLSVAGGRAARADRPERRRQDHAVPLHRRHPCRPPTAGCSLFGTDITRLPEHRRTGLGMARTFQISNVCTDLTVMENVFLAMLGTDRAQVDHVPPGFRVSRTCAIAGAIVLSRVGLDGRADETVKFLSYGERRQLELALALASNPKVVLLDEPCAGLSPSERQRFSGLIRELPRDITLVMIEHDIDIALALADRVTVLHRGNIILDGTPDEVKRNGQVREVYFGRV